MNSERTRELLERVQKGSLSIEDALSQLKNAPLVDLDFAKIDTQRELRCGYPEVIYCQGKTPLQVGEIAKTIAKNSERLLATRASFDDYQEIKTHIDQAVFHETARCVTYEKDLTVNKKSGVLVACAGTSDLPVAEEARVTAEIFGSQVETVYDAGVAGIHRLLNQVDKIHKANAIVVVAGMEGALASVVGGLSAVPVFAVPTSVGYGASFGGIAPLLTMLNSCAAGVSVVNIDNGFGAGYLANMVNQSSRLTP